VPGLVTEGQTPGLVTEGQTPDELQANVHEALNALLKTWAELARDLPSAPRPFLADRPQTVIRELEISREFRPLK